MPARPSPSAASSPARSSWATPAGMRARTTHSSGRGPARPSGRPAPHRRPRQRRELNVDRRPDGTILPLSDVKLRSVFGDFPAHTEGRRAGSTSARRGCSQSIIEIETPILADAGYPKITIHQEAADRFNAAFDRIAAANLSHLVLSCPGAFVPRHRAGIQAVGSARIPWGVAIDLNVAWNSYGAEPAPSAPMARCARLVPHFEAEASPGAAIFHRPTRTECISSWPARTSRHTAIDRPVRAGRRRNGHRPETWSERRQARRTTGRHSNATATRAFPGWDLRRR